MTEARAARGSRSTRSSVTACNNVNSPDAVRRNPMRCPPVPESFAQIVGERSHIKAGRTDQSQRHDTPVDTADVDLVRRDLHRGRKRAGWLAVAA